MPPTPSMPPSPDEPEPFAVPGKTSALKDASDYAINAAITEAEYLHSSSAVPAKGKLSDAMCYRMQTEAKELMERYDFKGAVELLERVQLERKDDDFPELLYYYYLSLYAVSKGNGEEGRKWCRKAIQVERIGGGGGEVGIIGTNWAVVNGWYDDFCDEEEGGVGEVEVVETIPAIVDRTLSELRSMDLKEVCKETGIKAGKKGEMKKELQEWFAKRIVGEAKIT
ncbi:hypothetical protein TrRE_jg9540 [Triparma retinervis]|uniref:SAP domain-containing protein n=1 Tax=Triparma retinervis TaxID=2557542 RepID=A0A9W7DU07_9STRA|nr:hypothetical protein TrRE_jg9540 [Triparma retinervis]